MTQQENDLILSADNLITLINLGELEPRLQSDREKVLKFLEYRPDLKKLDINKYAILLGFAITKSYCY